MCLCVARAKVPSLISARPLAALGLSARRPYSIYRLQSERRLPDLLGKVSGAPATQKRTMQGAPDLLQTEPRTLARKNSWLRSLRRRSDLPSRSRTVAGMILSKNLRLKHRTILPLKTKIRPSLEGFLASKILLLTHKNQKYQFLTRCLEPIWVKVSRSI